MPVNKKPRPPKPPVPTKPTGPRKDSKPRPKPGSGGFGRAEDQVIRAASSYINTAGSAVRSVAGAVGKVGNTAGKAVSTASKIATGNIGKGFAPGTLMGPAAKKRPERGPGGSKPQGGRLAKVETKRDPKEAMQPRGDKRKKPTPRPVRGGGSKPKLPRAY